jgi:hypothetical protein
MIPIYQREYFSVILSRPESFSIWWNWVSDYSGRVLTKPMDRLYAMAGLTSYFQRITNYTPLAGLWKENLARDLLWRYARAKYPKDVSPSSLGIPS